MKWPNYADNMHTINNDFSLASLMSMLQVETYEGLDVLSNE